ncbi:MAG TPA: helicase C-terminal domain-containing protein [Spirochaetia bacterium]|nr:helicase C-terminal domain-containing protein [Spirochaetia bacterium]
MFLPGAFVVVAPGVTDSAVLDLTCVEDGQPRQTFRLAVSEMEGPGDSPVTGFLDRHIPVAAQPGKSQSWRGVFSAAEPVADLAELAGVVLPTVPFRPGELARALELSGEPSGSLFYALVLAAMGRRLAELETGILHQLAEFLRRGNSPWAGPVSALADRAATTFRDNSIRGRAANEGALWRVKRRRETTDAVVIDAQAALAQLSDQVGRRLAGFQRRPQQEEMVRAVAAALNGGQCLLMEGATGTGKSLAYLLPAVLWAGKGGRRVLVATHTINLQEQLVSKDLPLLRDAGLEFTAALVKGRQNYLCLLRWSDVLREEVTVTEAALFARVLVWSLTTATGDRAELGLEGGGAEAWARIQADSDGCPGPLCPHWNTGCFVSLARQAAEDADVLVANHSLLFSDLLAGGRVLPEYGALVVDEAHHLEDGASEFLGRRLALWGLLMVAGATERALSRLAGLPALASAVWQPGVQRCRNSLVHSRKETLAFFDRLGKSLWPEGQEGRQSVRLYEGTLAGLDDECRRLVRLWQDTADGLDSLTGGLAEGGEAWAALAVDLGRLIAQWRQAGADLTQIWAAGDDNQVYWAEPGRSGCALRSAPAEVAVVLQENLLAPERPVILTSATLTVNGCFDHFAERTGVTLLSPDRVALCRVESPFDYGTQALFAVTTGLPGREGRGYQEALAGAILSLVRAAGGRTMVLFTSHQSLRATYRMVKSPLEGDGIRLLGHGIDSSRSRLLEEFQAATKAVLFGAASFWEGVDIPGEALSLVIIVKLPFVPPGDPVQEARLEALARRRLDGFARLSVPQAVIRFKQGFGRLIRSTSDRGSIVVLDDRLVTRRYGRRFLASLPGSVPLREGDLASCASQVAEWLGGGDSGAPGPSGK